jgi:NhaA family Na+:H+ antiporter
MSPSDHRPARSWISSDRAVPRLLVRPLREFMDTEVAGGVVLLAAALIALVWANSPLGDTYESLWSTKVTIGVGDWALVEDLRHWVNDGLMAVFFFVVGLEIKREIVKGELSTAKAAAMPVIAALGGMVVPAALYLVLTPGGAAGHGWGIPMATDIAFALGVLALCGPRIPSSLRVFLLSLAIVDDVGAIVVIALVYTPDLDVAFIAVAAAGLLAVVALRAVRVWWIPVYVVIGTAIWFATLRSGVHATIAGVILGLLTPVRALNPDAMQDLLIEEDDLADGQLSAAEARRARWRAQASVSVAERIAHELHPWTSFVVVPLFALANAGVELSADSLRTAASSPVTRGVLVGLVVGKIIGITGFAWGGERLGVAALPAGVGWLQMTGVAAVAGIGFTVSIFIAGLAFEDGSLVEEAKMGILAASVLATAIGATVLRVGRRERRPVQPGDPRTRAGEA